VRAECPAEAIFPDTKAGLESWLKLNADYALVWPNITIKASRLRCEGIRWRARKVRAVFFVEARARRLEKA
jgi:uncharacterized protein DUF3470